MYSTFQNKSEKLKTNYGKAKIFMQQFIAFQKIGLVYIVAISNEQLINYNL